MRLTGGSLTPSQALTKGVVDHIKGYKEDLGDISGILVGVFAGPVAGAIWEEVASEEGDLGGVGSLDAAIRESITTGLNALVVNLLEGHASDTPQSLSPEGLLGVLAQQLLDPLYVPGQPCLAPAPLLRDLLDIALGEAGGLISTMTAKVETSILDWLIPGYITGVELDRSIQAILDDPITAALNLVLGQRNRIDCVVTGELGVGIDVLSAETQHIQDAVEGVWI